MQAKEALETVDDWLEWFGDEDGDFEVIDNGNSIIIVLNEE